MTDPLAHSTLPISVIVPAHNEAAVLAATLEAVIGDGIQVIVVCNGCTDDSASIARRFPVEVVEIDEASKTAALNVGDRLALHFPRFYVDADIVVTSGDVRRAAAELTDSIHIVAPQPVADLSASSWPVRAFYDVWRVLPYYRSMGGAGVLGVDSVGRGRFGEFPAIIADDVFLRLHMRPDERSVAPVTCQVRAPRTTWSLVKVKTRAHLGQLQLRRNHPELVVVERLDHAGALRDLAHDPRRWPSIAIYLSIRAVARLRARRQFRSGRHLQWERDLTTRTNSAHDKSAVPSDGG